MLFSFSEACPKRLRVLQRGDGKNHPIHLGVPRFENSGIHRTRVNKALTARCDAARVRTGNFVRRKSSLFTKMMPMVTE